MANYSSVKATIDANIKTNNNQAITGAILNGVLDEMVDALASGYLYKGVATPSTNPGSPDAKVFYVATPGTYTYFGNQTVPPATTGFFRWDTSWHLDTISTGVADGAVTSSKIASGAITSSKIASEAVTEAKLASALVTKLFSTGYKFAGVATPNGNPGTPNQDVFYLAGEGTYPNYGTAVIMQGQVGVLKYNGGWTTEIISGVGQIVEMANVEEEGLFFADSHLYIGVKIVQEGLTSINSITYREV